MSMPRICGSRCEPADMAREVAAYILPDDVEAPHDLAPYRIGPAIGAAQHGEGQNHG